MEKITLKLYEFINLEADLNGIRNQSNGETVYKGLLSYSLPIVTKYWLTKLSKSLIEEKSIIEELRDELIKKYGDLDENKNIGVPMFIEEKDSSGNTIMTTIKNENGEESHKPKTIVNPKYIEFNKEYSEILQQEKELEYRPIFLSEICTKEHPYGFEAEENYDTFFKLVVAPIE